MRHAWIIALLLGLALAARGAEPATAPAGPTQLARNLRAGKPQRLVTYGTSLTAGGAWVKQVGAQLKERFPDLLTVTNSGAGGKASDWGVKNLDEKVIKLKPDTVLMEFAINDAFSAYHITQEQARKNLDDMIARIRRALPGCEIILMTMDPPTGVPLSRRHDVEAYYENYRDAAKEHELRLIDLYVPWKKILDADPAKYAALVPDGVHPTEAGCAQVITPHLLAALLGESPGK